MFFLDNYFGHDDAVYACLRLLSFLERRKISLSQAVGVFTHYVSSPEIKLMVADSVKFGLISGPIKQDLINTWPEAEINEIDGVRIDTPALMVAMRASQNGPYITVRFESTDSASYTQVKSKVRDILNSHPEIRWENGVNTQSLS
jgi:phosphomannomutase